MRVVTDFARSGGRAAGELIGTLPDDVQARLADAVARGARLAIGVTIGAGGDSLVFLDLIDAAGTAHRVAALPATVSERH